MPSLIDDNIACLRQGLTLLERISGDDYAAPEPRCHGSSIGGHFRHNVDHYLSFIRGLATGSVDYDARARDRRLETEPEMAAERIAKIVAELAKLSADQLDASVSVAMDSGDSLPEPARSTVRRELQFLLSHTVHHYALIATIRVLQGYQTPENFGVAPSTIKHHLSH